ncbi:MAG: hypothetical protein LBE36_11905 [Flavobacteriaceae bacterium]|jgi:hypothetical protein|nr:hypothetical protein [Flavobacteriaceae bacterium]
MKLKTTFLALFLFNSVFAQQKPTINLSYSKWLATYDFVKNLSDNYPDNGFKQVFRASKFYNPHYTDLIKRFDTLKLDESYNFQDFPEGLKTPFQSIDFIKKNLITATSIEQFKTETFGVVPNSELFAFSEILSEFKPIYDELIYFPHQNEFENQLVELKDYVQKSNLEKFFEQGLIFYGSAWDNSVPMDIAIIPSIEKDRFNAGAFLNTAFGKIPLNIKEIGNDDLFSVLMHEIYHILYDAQPLEFKLKIQSWFNKNPSKNSQYAYLLLNEVLATATGNGYVYEHLNGKPYEGDWYNFKYFNLLAKQIYPMVKDYINQQKTIDQDFVNQYIAFYDAFPDWSNELDNLFRNRYVLSDNPKDIDYFRKNYVASHGIDEDVFSQSNLEKLKEARLTKVIIISSDHKDKLSRVKSIFPELKNLKYNARKEFVYTADLQDKTKLIIINKHSTSLEKLFDDNFKNRKIE